MLLSTVSVVVEIVADSVTFIVVLFSSISPPTLSPVYIINPDYVYVLIGFLIVLILKASVDPAAIVELNPLLIVNF